MIRQLKPDPHAPLALRGAGFDATKPTPRGNLRTISIYRIDNLIEIMGYDSRGAWLQRYRMKFHADDVETFITALRIAVAGELGAQALMEEYHATLHLPTD